MFFPFGLILFLEPPTAFFTGWSDVSPDKRPMYLAIGLMIIYIAVLYTPVFANYFGLVTPGGPEKMIIGGALIGWFVVLRTVWRYKWFEWIITIEDSVAE